MSSYSGKKISLIALVESPYQAFVLRNLIVEESPNLFSKNYNICKIRRIILV